MNNRIEQDIERSARTAAWGVREDSPLWMTGIDRSDVDRRTFQLSDKRVQRIVRLRLVGDDDIAAPPFWDVSYCYGEILDNGRRFLAHVNLGDYQIRKIGRGRWARVDKGHLIELAKDAKRFAKALDLLDDNVISILT